MDGAICHYCRKSRCECEQQPTFVTKRDTDFTLQNCKSSDEYEYRIANMLQYAMTLLGEECIKFPCMGIFNEPARYRCQPCQRKAALLRAWRGTPRLGTPWNGEEK